MVPTPRHRRAFRGKNVWFRRSISQNARVVNRNFEKDSEGNTLSAGQQEYFNDSKVTDGNGNLLATYHVTPNTVNDNITAVHGYTLAIILSMVD